MCRVGRPPTQEGVTLVGGVTSVSVGGNRCTADRGEGTALLNEVVTNPYLGVLVIKHLFHLLVLEPRPHSGSVRLDRNVSGNRFVATQVIF